jgi:D-sedoheptulose 7-phosphate isomerase
MPAETVTASALAEARRVLDAFITDPANLESIEILAVLLHQRFAAGHKAMICGNGGSACDAMHFAEELTGRFRRDRAALPAIACTDLGHITCTANDYGFEHIYSRWVEALGRPGDILIALSTSGNSGNLIRAVQAARARDMTTIALLGKGGGKLKGECDHEIIAPGQHSDRIQEIHMLILHVLVEGIESLMPEG